MNNNLLKVAIQAAKSAGNIIMHYYQQDLDVQKKEDGSPLTLVDQESHKEILRCLINSDLPVVSEEGDDLVAGNRYWLVDPLDGTKDFLAHTGEFTVNIALVEGAYTKLGVVFAPALGKMFYGGVGMGAWCASGNSLINLQPKAKSRDCRMAVSRLHDHPDVNLFASKNKINNIIKVGSALKYVMIASGDVEVSVRLVGSLEWDTAAGQAILEAVGGQILDWSTGESLKYGKPERRNPRFIAIRSPYSLSDFVRKKYEKDFL